MKSILKSAFINEDFIITLVGFTPLVFSGVDLFFVMIIYLSLCFLLGPFTFFLISNLENRHSILNPSELNNPILVLGGGYVPVEGMPQNQVIHHGSMGRLLEGLRIYKYSNSQQLVVSGPSLKEGSPSLAQIQKELVIELMGLCDSKITKLDYPKNTEEEALAYKEIFGKTTPIVVTKSIHLPRTIATFEKFNLEIIPAPCNFIFKDKTLAPKHYFLPAFSHAGFLGELIKEIFGFIYLEIKNLYNTIMGLKKIQSWGNLSKVMQKEFANRLAK